MHDGGGVGWVGALTFTPRTLFDVRSEPSLKSLEVGPLILTPLKFYAIFFDTLDVSMRKVYEGTKKKHIKL